MDHPTFELSEFNRGIRQAVQTVQLMLFIHVRKRDFQGTALAVLALRLIYGKPIELVSDRHTQDDRSFVARAQPEALRLLATLEIPQAMSSEIDRTARSCGLTPKKARRLVLFSESAQLVQAHWEKQYGSESPVEQLPKICQLKTQREISFVRKAEGSSMDDDGTIHHVVELDFDANEIWGQKKQRSLKRKQ